MIKEFMTKLSVNINKIATLRNARGENNPNVLQTALDIISFGADGITVHPRPDGRHIRLSDVYDLKKKINVELNIEGYPSNEYLELVNQVKPAQATLVPDPPEALTSDAGWNVKKNEGFLDQNKAHHILKHDLLRLPISLGYSSPKIPNFLDLNHDQR